MWESTDNVGWSFWSMLRGNIRNDHNAPVTSIHLLYGLAVGLLWNLELPGFRLWSRWTQFPYLVKGLPLCFRETFSSFHFIQRQFISSLVLSEFGIAWSWKLTDENNIFPLWVLFKNYYICPGIWLSLGEILQVDFRWLVF